MRLAFADPPYYRCCRLYGHRHEGAYGCWDDIATHRTLFDHLSGFDGWFCCASSPSLKEIIRLAPDARLGAWVKPFAAYKKNVRIAYTWEPVLFTPGRDSSMDGALVGRDHLSEPITLQKGLTGAKSERFCVWALTLLGYVPGDEVVDLFPGTGVMDRVLSNWQLALL
jgi:hypothetical protein